MASRRVDISEKDDQGTRKVVSHTFYGRDAKEAKHNERSHRKSDKFFDAAMSGRPYKGIRLEVRNMDRGRHKKRMSKRY